MAQAFCETLKLRNVTANDCKIRVFQLGSEPPQENINFPISHKRKESIVRLEVTGYGYGGDPKLNPKKRTWNPWICGYDIPSSDDELFEDIEENNSSSLPAQPPFQKLNSSSHASVGSNADFGMEMMSPGSSEKLEILSENSGPEKQLAEMLAFQEMKMPYPPFTNSSSANPGEPGASIPISSAIPMPLGEPGSSPNNILGLPPEVFKEDDITPMGDDEGSGEDSEESDKEASRDRKTSKGQMETPTSGARKKPTSQGASLNFGDEEIDARKRQLYDVVDRSKPKETTRASPITSKLVKRRNDKGEELDRNKQNTVGSNREDSKDRGLGRNMGMDNSEVNRITQGRRLTEVLRIKDDDTLRGPQNAQGTKSSQEPADSNEVDRGALRESQNTKQMPLPPVSLRELKEVDRTKIESTTRETPNTTGKLVELRGKGSVDSGNVDRTKKNTVGKELVERSDDDDEDTEETYGSNEVTANIKRITKGAGKTGT